MSTDAESESVRRNAAGWDRIADAYHEARGWPEDVLAWGIRCSPEPELRVLDPIAGRRVLVLGCGAGQDLVALWRLGPPSRLVGVDASAEQLRLARTRLAARDVTVELRHQSMHDLDGLADNSFDLIVSVHAMTYVENAADTLHEAWRVLVPGGQVAFSVHHPVDASTDDAPPYGFIKSYFEPVTDWSWDALGGAASPFRSWQRTVADWFGLMRDAGFTVERLLEPRPVDSALWRASGWSGPPYYHKLATVPGTLILAGRKC